MGDSLDFLGIDLYFVVSYYITNCIPISLTVSIFPDSPIPRFPILVIAIFEALIALFFESFPVFITSHFIV